MQKRSNTHAGAWESEIRALTVVSYERSETILKLKSQLQEVTMDKNEALYRVKKVENEIQSLNSALESYGYIDNSDGCNF